MPPPVEVPPSRGGVYVVYGLPRSGLFVRGDTDNGGAVDITDAIFVLEHLFRGGSAPRCDNAADADDSGGIQITDAIYLLRYLFLGGAPPPAPFPEAGRDPTGDELSCGRT